MFVALTNCDKLSNRDKDDFQVPGGYFQIRRSGGLDLTSSWRQNLGQGLAKFTK